MVKQAGIDKNISTHKLCHTYATNLLNADAELVDIKALLGHESIATTQIYTNVEQECGEGGGEVVSHPAAFQPARLICGLVKLLFYYRGLIMPFLKLISLECHITEDITGTDEAYIRINGRRVWKQDIDTGRSKRLDGVGRIEFAENCRIDLYDKDTGGPLDRDDHLGAAYVWARQANEAEQHIPFNGPRWSYTLHCKVEN